MIAFNPKARKDIITAKNELEKVCEKVEILELRSDSSKLSRYKIAVCSLLSRRPYTVNWMKSRNMHPKIEEYLSKIDFDLIHYDTIGLAEYVDVRGMERLPKVLNHHNIESSMMYRRCFLEPNIFKRLYFYIESVKLKKYEKSKCSRFDLNITVSKLDGKVLKNIVGNIPLAEVPNGVDIEYFTSNNKKIRRKNLVFAGSLNWYPNYNAMVYFCREIWPLLKRQIPDVNMTIIGRGGAKLKWLIQDQTDIKLTGFVDDVRPYLERAEAYVCPIRDGGGTKVKILDALSMEKAVVAHPVACEGIDVTPSKNVLLAKKPGEFVEQLKKIFDSQNLRLSLGKEGRKLIEQKYSFEIIGDKLNNLYNKIIRTRSIQSKNLRN